MKHKKILPNVDLLLNKDLNLRSDWIKMKIDNFRKELKSLPKMKILTLQTYHLKIVSKCHIRESIRTSATKLDRSYHCTLDLPDSLQWFRRTRNHYHTNCYWSWTCKYSHVRNTQTHLTTQRSSLTFCSHVLEYFQCSLSSLSSTSTSMSEITIWCFYQTSWALSDTWSWLTMLQESLNLPDSS